MNKKVLIAFLVISIILLIVSIFLFLTAGSGCPQLAFIDPQTGTTRLAYDDCVMSQNIIASIIGLIGIIGVAFSTFKLLKK
ncbi:hypothetical protein JXB28_06225 [Candidatus Woesearchaeota archaeon]|nr:hypothetical protein [Candidatus Woesearchaeota archaeon]